MRGAVVGKLDKGGVRHHSRMKSNACRFCLLSRHPPERMRLSVSAPLSGDVHRYFPSAERSPPYLVHLGPGARPTSPAGREPSGLSKISISLRLVPVLATDSCKSFKDSSHGKTLKETKRGSDPSPGIVVGVWNFLVNTLGER